MLGIRYPMEVNLVGDTGETLRALIPLLERKADRSWREEIEGGVGELVAADGGPRRCRTADPINPQRVFWELSPRLPDRAILTVGLGLGGQLVRARPQDPRGHDGVAVGQRWRRWARACRTRSPPSSPTPTGR